MLENLHVKNLALIDEAEVEFTEGLNILTGETGAGKSIVLGSVSLALGGRYTADMLRRGADYGLAELTFSVRDEKQKEKLAALDIFPEDGQIIISRKLMDGRSTSRINGETVPLARLRQVSELLIDIHGQHEHQSLLYKKNHLAILDAYADEGAQLKKDVQSAYRTFRENEKELSRADIDEAERLKEISFLEFEIQEIQRAGLSPEEAREVEESYRRMTNGKKLAEKVQEAYASTAGEPGGNASDALSRAIRALQDISGYDGRAEELCSQLLEVDGLLNDFNRELADYAQELSFSPEDFYETETRLDEINRLKAKYGSTVEEILSYAREKEERLQVLRDYDAWLEELKKKAGDSRKELERLCGKLSAIRKAAAGKLEQQISEGLKDLNFLDVQFRIQFQDTRDFTPEGTDEVEFLISMNPGEPLRPLSEVASGGELSRIMLAIKSVLADKDETETLIFDEIDVGISGRTAQKVSEKMRLIGKKHQVICITHLAQIAAMADTHFAIEKRTEEGRTSTSIYRLDEEASVRELARILGGAEITDTVLENAREMKMLAGRLKE